MANILSSLICRAGTLGASSARTQAGLALDSAYTPGSAGDALGFRFVAERTTTLTTVDFYVQAVAGGAGSTVVTVELRNTNTATTPDTAGAVIASTSVNYGTTANQWKRATLNGAVTAGTEYWIVFGNQNTTETVDYPTVTYTGGLNHASSSLVTAFNAFTSTNGFSTGTAVGLPCPVCIRFADGPPIGNPYTVQNTGFTNNTEERGIRWANGPDVDEEIIGVAFGSVTNVTGVKIYEGSTAPGGSTLATATGTTGALARGIILFSSVVRLRKGVPLRVVLTVSANSTAPAVYQIQHPAYANIADVATVGFMGDAINNWFATQGNGGSWTDYNTSSAMYAPRIHLIRNREYASVVKLVGAGGGLIA